MLVLWAAAMLPLEAIIAILLVYSAFVLLILMASALGVELDEYIQTRREKNLPSYTRHGAFC